MERRVWRAVAVLITVVVALYGGSQAWALLVHQQTVVNARPYHVHISRLDLDSADAEVSVDPGPSDQVTVRQILGWTLRRPTVTMAWEGDVLTISVRCRQVIGIGEPGCSTRLEVRVPRETQVTGEGSSGHIQVRDLAGGVHLQTRSGSILLSGIGGSIWATSNSGLVSGTALSSSEVQTATGSGRVDLSFDRAPDTVTMIATSGELFLTVPTGSRYKISGHSTSGSRSIDPALSDTESPHTIDVVTTSGSATIGWPSS